MTTAAAPTTWRHPLLSNILSYTTQMIVAKGIRLIDWPDYVFELDSTISRMVLDMATGNMATWQQSVDKFLGSIEENYVACYATVKSQNITQVFITLYLCRASSPYIVLNTRRATEKKDCQ